MGRGNVDSSTVSASACGYVYGRGAGSITVSRRTRSRIDVAPSPEWLRHMSDDAERLLAASIQCYYRSRAAVRSSGFLFFLCHAGMDRGRILLERAVGRTEQRERKSTHLPDPD